MILTEEQAKTPGQLAYEHNCRAIPSLRYPNPRKSWAELSDRLRKTWENVAVARIGKSGRP